MPCFLFSGGLNLRAHLSKAENCQKELFSRRSARHLDKYIAIKNVLDYPHPFPFPTYLVTPPAPLHITKVTCRMSFYVPSKQDYGAFPTTCNDEIILKAFISLFLSLSCLPASPYPKNSLMALLLFLRCFPGLKKYSTFSGLPPPTALHFPPPFKFRLHKTLVGRLIATLRV